jgi:predicted Zn-dependent peptidase
MIFRQHTLPNGLTLIGEENPGALSMAAGYFVRTGARDETAEISGVSHFLEHMLFKGTEHRTAEEVNREFDEIGADYNAFTGEEATVYYGAVLPEHQGSLVDLLTDMMRPSLRVDDFEMEKKVIQEEIALYKDRPQFTAIDEARSTYYENHPLGQSVLGTEETIGALQRDQMHEYWRRRYAPNNLLLALAGKFDWDDTVSRLERSAGPWEPAETERLGPPFEPRSRVRVIRNDKIHRAHLCLVAPGVSAQNDQRLACDVVSDIIGGGEGSRLYWELVEPGLAESVRFSHDEEDGFGAFFAYSSCDPERAQVVLDRMRGVFDKATAEGFHPEELERSKRKIASGLVLHDETPRGRLFHVGFDWLYRKQHRPLDAVIDRYLAVGLDELQATLAGRPFDRATVVALGPLDELV